MHTGDGKAEKSEYALVQSTLMTWGFKVHLSLADTKKSGVALLVRKDLVPQRVTFNLPGEAEPHHPEGRIILAEFER